MYRKTANEDEHGLLIMNVELHRLEESCFVMLVLEIGRDSTECEVGTVMVW